MSQGRKHAWTPGDRRVRVLLALHKAVAPLTLAEVTVACDEHAPKPRHIVSAMLRYLKRAEQVDYTPAAHGASTTLGGTYAINEHGREWLTAKGFLDPDAAPPEDEPITTGAMRAERATQVQTVALAGQAPARPIASIFHLAQLHAEACT